MEFRTFIRATTLLFLGGTLAATVALATPILLRFPPDRPGCDTPIHWSLGTVDPRFPVDERTFRKSVIEAEAIWEEGLGKDLFVYDPSSPFIVTTVYDDRQKMTEEAADLEKRYQAYQETSTAIKTRYDALRSRYDRDMASFDVRVAKYEKALAKYNADVKDANESGMITEDEYDALEKRRKDLEKERVALTAESDRLNGVANDINVLAKKLNAGTTAINEHIRTFRDTYGEPQPFVEGLYDPDATSITVFQFKGKDDLRLVLAHELGHALGIEEHAETPTSIMHYLMGEQDIDHPSPTDEDKAAYAIACPDRMLSKRETVARYLTQTPWPGMNASELFRMITE